MTSAREVVLGRVDAALAAPAPGRTRNEEADPPPAPARAPLAVGGALVDLFARRVADYRAEVVRCTDVGAAVGAACARHGARDVVVAPGVPPAWRAEGVRWRPEPPTLAELDGAAGVLTAAAVAIAETGTVALDHAPDQGRRALSLVPDLHLCVVRAEQVVATVPEALGRLRAAVERGRPITLISGPSATSDIELERVEGVHGPRRLVVLVVDGPAW